MDENACKRSRKRAAVMAAMIPVIIVVYWLMFFREGPRVRAKDELKRREGAIMSQMDRIAAEEAAKKEVEEAAGPSPETPSLPAADTPSADPKPGP